MKLGLLAFDLGDSYDITDIVTYAMKAEESNFTRFWLGEHYSKNLWCNPEPLLPVILGMTEDIKVGAAGILLKLHSSYRVALNFKLLNSFFPNRVDLGLAKGTIIPTVTDHLYDAESIKPTPVDQKIQNIFSYYSDETSFEEKEVFIPPIKYPVPNVWILSISYRTLDLCIQHQCGYSRSLFHSSSNLDFSKDEILKFKESYFKKHGEEPKINIAFSGLIGSSMEDAKKRFSKSAYTNSSVVVPNIIGCKNYFQDKLMSMYEDYGVDEFVFLDLSPTFENKMKNVEILGEIISQQA